MVLSCMKQGVAISREGPVAHLINKWLPVAPEPAARGEQQPGTRERRPESRQIWGAIWGLPVVCGLGYIPPLG